MNRKLMMGALCALSVTGCVVTPPPPPPPPPVAVSAPPPPPGAGQQGRAGVVMGTQAQPGPGGH